MEKNAPPVVGEKRRRPDSPDEIPRGRPLPPLPAKGLLRSLWASISSPAASFLRRVHEAIPAGRNNFVLTDVHMTMMFLVFQRMPIQDVLRCSMTCKTFKCIIQSEEFRSCFRRATKFTGPIVAVITHPYASLIPVAIPPESPFQNLLLNFDFTKNFKHISDVRDGYVLLYDSSRVENQSFLLANPLTRVMTEISMKPHNPLHIYIAAGFIPSDHSFDYEIIVLYAHKTGNPRDLTTALFNSRKGSWETITHTLDHPAPQSNRDVRLPSILIKTKWNLLIKGSCVLTTDIIRPPFTIVDRSRDMQDTTVRISAIPFPTPYPGETKSTAFDNILGKAGEDLCFILAEPGVAGLQIWRCDLSSSAPHAFSSPTYYPLGVDRAMLLGFAEANNVAIVQPEVLEPGQTLLINIHSSAEDPMSKEGTDVDLFGYELEWPPIRPRPSSARS